MGILWDWQSEQNEPIYGGFRMHVHRYKHNKKKVERSSIQSLFQKTPQGTWLKLLKTSALFER